MAVEADLGLRRAHQSDETIITLVPKIADVRAAAKEPMQEMGKKSSGECFQAQATTALETRVAKMTKSIAAGR